MLAPDQRLEDGIGDAHEEGAGEYLRPETGSFGDAAGNDRRDAGGETEQEEEADQLIPLVVAQQRRGGVQKVDPVGNGIADQKIDQGGNGPVREDFDERVDLAFFANRTYLEKGKAGVHGKNHDRPQHEKKYVAPVAKGLNGRLHCLQTSLSDFWTTPLSPEESLCIQLPCPASEGRRINILDVLRGPPPRIAAQPLISDATKLTTL